MRRLSQLRVMTVGWPRWPFPRSLAGAVADQLGRAPAARVRPVLAGRRAPLGSGGAAGGSNGSGGASGTAGATGGSGTGGLSLGAGEGNGRGRCPGQLRRRGRQRRRRPVYDGHLLRRLQELTAGQAPGGNWTKSTNLGAVAVDDTQAHSGKKSVKFTTQSSSGLKTAYIRLGNAAGKTVFPAPGNSFYGRMMFRLESAPDGVGSLDAARGQRPRAGQDLPCAVPLRRAAPRHAGGDLRRQPVDGELRKPLIPYGGQRPQQRLLGARQQGRRARGQVVVRRLGSSTERTTRCACGWTVPPFRA